MNTAPSDEHARRQAAVEYVVAVNAAQARAQQQVGRYVSLSELGGLPSVPVGFVPRIITDQWSYAAIVKDVFDACGFALLSDERGVIYEAQPRTVRSQGSNAPAEDE